jgi:hypothetical protein
MDIFLIILLFAIGIINFVAVNVFFDYCNIGKTKPLYISTIFERIVVIITILVGAIDIGIAILLIGGW